MNATRDLRADVLVVALLCACALITARPAMAVSILTADAFGTASAGPDIAIPDKLVTPGVGSVAVTFGAAASASVSTIALSGSALGTGEARFGVLAGRAEAEASTSPPSIHLVDGRVILNMGFLDTAVVMSSLLAPETPVRLTFVMTLDATAIHFVNGPIVPGHVGASARAEATITDIESGASTPGFPVRPHTVVNSIGDRITLTTFEFDTAIGHHLELGVDLNVVAAATIAAAGFSVYASAGNAEVDAGETAHFFYRPSGDVRLVSESGHDYAFPGSVPGPGPGPTPGGSVPEPGSLALVCFGVGGLVAARRVCRKHGGPASSLRYPPAAASLRAVLGPAADID